MKERAKEIVLYFIEHKVATIEELMTYVKVSEKTVLHDICDVELFFFQNNIRLERKPGVGFRIITDLDETQLEKIKIQLENNTALDLDSRSGRAIKIILILLCSKETMTLQELSEMVFVSKGTLLKDIEIVEKIIKGNGLSLQKIRNKGICLLGDELCLRSLLSKILNDYSFITRTSIKKSSQLLHRGMNREIFTIFNERDVELTQIFVMKVEKEMNFELTDASYSTLVIHLLITIQRIIQKNPIYFDDEEFKQLKEYPEFQAALKIKTMMETGFHITIPEAELGYITLHLLVAKPSYVPHEGKQENSSNLEELVVEMINKTEKITGLQLCKDQEFKEGLLYHLRPAIHRMQYNLTIKNPFLDKIKREYPEAFDIAIHCFEMIKQTWQVTYCEDEIAYIALHIQASMERNKVKKEFLSVGIVCTTGYGSSQLVRAKLENEFSIFDEIINLSVSDVLNERKQRSLDFIISTIPLELKDLPVIIVNPFLAKEDMQRIRNFLTTVKKQKQRSVTNKAFLFDEKLILIAKEPTDNIAAIQEVVTNLTIGNYVGEGYLASVLHREKISSTAYENIAIPHGDPKIVKKPFLYVYINEEGITWNETIVNIFFLIGVNAQNEHDLKEIFDFLYDLISDKVFIHKLIHMTSPKQALQLILDRKE